MVEMTAPQPTDVVATLPQAPWLPAAVGEYLREHHPAISATPGCASTSHHGLSPGFDVLVPLLLQREFIAAQVSAMERLKV